MMAKKSTVLWSFSSGMALGFLAGLLTAPQKGHTTRKVLLKRARTLRADLDRTRGPQTYYRRSA